MNVRKYRAAFLALVIPFVLGVFSSALHAAPNSGKITGVVMDGAGTPQMGATVIVTSAALLNSASVELLTNDRGNFRVDLGQRGIEKPL